MTGLLILIGLVVVPLLVWQVLDPKGAWHALEGWKFRDPEANEPSDTAYGLTQVGGVVSLIALVVVGGVLMSSWRDVDDDSDASSSTYPSDVYDSYPTSTWDVRDIGPGTVVGYDYPSDLTIRLVVHGGPGFGVGLDGGCSTKVQVFEHSNAVVIAVTRQESTDYNGAFTVDCSIPSTEQTTVTRPLQEPLGDRPILTAASVAAPTGDLAPGPDVRPEPLVEVPKPGVYRPLAPVTIDPAWVRVPLLAGVDSLRGH